MGGTGSRQSLAPLATSPSAGLSNPLPEATGRGLGGTAAARRREAPGAAQGRRRAAGSCRATHRELS